MSLYEYSTKELKTQMARRKEAAEEYYRNTLMFSEKAGLMCEVHPSGHYYVCNGDWYGSRYGDYFIIHSSKEGLNPPSEDELIIITDWVEIQRSSLSKSERKYWYVPNYDEYINDNWDDEIPF